MYTVVGSNGQTYGPVDVATLRAWAQEGRVTPETDIIDGVSGQTIKASSLQDLYDVFPSPPTFGQVNQGQPGQSVGFAQPGSAFGQQGSVYSQSGGAFASPPAPYYRAPGQPGVGGKSKVAAALLAFFLGGFGIHRFYLGYTTIGIIQLVLCCTGISSIWAIVDAIMILTGSLPDSDGMPLV